MKLSTALTVLFVGLKLTEHIDWSWGWVTSPAAISLAFNTLKLFLESLKESLKETIK